LSISLGDVISIENKEDPSQPHHLARIISMWQEGNSSYFHCIHFARGANTVLGDGANPSEVFLTNHCTVIRTFVRVFSKKFLFYSNVGRKNELYCGKSERKIQEFSGRNFRLDNVWSLQGKNKILLRL
jgi:hypothetical protein